MLCAASSDVYVLCPIVSLLSLQTTLFFLTRQDRLVALKTFASRIKYAKNAPYVVANECGESLWAKTVPRQGLQPF